MNKKKFMNKIVPNTRKVKSRNTKEIVHFVFSDLKWENVTYSKSHHVCEFEQV